MDDDDGAGTAPSRDSPSGAITTLCCCVGCRFTRVISEGWMDCEAKVP